MTDTMKRSALPGQWDALDVVYPRESGRGEQVRSLLASLQCGNGLQDIALPGVYSLGFAVADDIVVGTTRETVLTSVVLVAGENDWELHCAATLWDEVTQFWRDQRAAQIDVVWGVPHSYGIPSVPTLVYTADRKPSLHVTIPTSDTYATYLTFRGKNDQEKMQWLQRCGVRSVQGKAPQHWYGYAVA